MTEPPSRARERREPNGGHALFLLDRDGNVATWNDGAELLCGYDAAVITGQHVARLYPSAGDDSSTIAHRALEVSQRAGRFETEGWHLRADGSRFWGIVVVTALKNADGDRVGFRWFVRDVTERLEATEQLTWALEAAPTGMLMVDAAGKIARVNEQVVKMFGYAREELINQPIEMLLPERFRAAHPRFRETFVGEVRRRPMGAGRDLYGRHKDGRDVPVEIGLNPLETQEGRFVLSSVVDITERKNAERDKELLLGKLQSLNAEQHAMLKEREVLLQEVHHRVKNNLQVISSLMSLQARQVDDASRRALEECEMRVQAIALIHEKLYQSRDYANVPFAEYVRALASNVLSASTPAGIEVELDLALQEDIRLAVDKAIPCGLLLNELATNALKHAFAGRAHGHLRVELSRKSERAITLTVADDGSGLADVTVMERRAPTSSLGLHLVRTLIRQLDAQLRVVSNATTGTRFEITIPS